METYDFLGGYFGARLSIIQHVPTGLFSFRLELMVKTPAGYLELLMSYTPDVSLGLIIIEIRLDNRV